MKKFTRRFVNTEEKKNRRSAISYIALTVISIAVLYFLGIPALGKLTALVSSLKKNDSEIVSSDTMPPPPPKFKYFPEYSNQKSMTLVGNTEAGAIVKLTFGGNEQEVLADGDGQFSFDINLENGTNIFAATATDQTGNQSQKTDDYQVVFDIKAPDLEITSPSDGTSYFGSSQRQATIQGKTEAEAAVTVNDRIISVEDDGSFQYTTTLNEGANTFNIKSKDLAGNTTEKNLTLNFSP